MVGDGRRSTTGARALESEEFVSPILAGTAIALVFVVLISLLLVEMPQSKALRVLFDQHTQKLSMVVAVSAMASSLYYSDVVGFIPCEFCWFQRIVMYPLAVLLVTATVSRSRIDTRYIVVLAAIGLPISIYHYQLQLFPEQAQVCSGAVACTDKSVNAFGFVTIPFMAGCGFLSILLLQVAEWRADLAYRRGMG